MGGAMEDDARLEAFFADLAEIAPNTPITAAEAGEVLELARVVAHRVERRFAPLTSYAMGLALDGDQPTEERAARIRRIREAAEGLTPPEEASQ